MKNKCVSIILMITMFLPMAQARIGSEGGGGGGGVIDGGNIYVVDLVEAGVEKSPYFDSSVNANPDFSKRIAKALQNLPNVPVDLLSQKLEEIYQNYDHALPLEILQMFELFSWQMVDFSLVHIPDENPVVDIAPTAQVQLASRTRRTLKLDSNAWAKLNPANRVALIIHEAIYSLVKTKNSDDARAIVGYLFSADFKDRGVEGYLNIIGDKLVYTGTSEVILDCTPGNSISDCGGDVGLMLLNSSEVAVGAEFVGKDGNVLYGTFEGSFDDGYIRVYNWSTLNNEKLYSRSKISSEQMAKSYCQDFMKNVSSKSFDISNGSDRELTLNDVKSVKSQAAIWAEHIPLSWSSDGAFLEYSNEAAMDLIPIGKESPWSAISQSSCEKSELALIKQTMAHLSLYK